MDGEFIAQIQKALNLARGHRYRELGKLEMLKDLNLVEKRMLSSPERGPVRFGVKIKDLLWDVIDTLEPDFPEDLQTTRCWDQ